MWKLLLSSSICMGCNLRKIIIFRTWTEQDNHFIQLHISQKISIIVIFWCLNLFYKNVYITVKICKYCLHFSKGEYWSKIASELSSLCQLLVLGIWPDFHSCVRSLLIIGFVEQTETYWMKYVLFIYNLLPGVQFRSLLTNLKLPDSFVLCIL